MDLDPLGSLDPRLRAVEDESINDSIIVHGASTHHPTDAAALATNGAADDVQQDQLSQTTASAANTVFPPGLVDPPSVATTTTASSATAGPTPASATSHDPNDLRRSRACEACRGLKVKCESDLLNPDGPCRRCTKARRECVVTQPTRRRQKKTDSRVAELEKKIDALTASLHASRGSGDADGGAALPQMTPAPYHLSEDIHATMGRNPRPSGFPHVEKDPRPEALSRPQPVTSGQKRKFHETGTPSPDGPDDPGPSDKPDAGRQHPDIIDRGIITIEEASALFLRYTEHMAPHLPAVVFPPDKTAADIRQAKPILFLAIMSVASSETAQTQRRLVMELSQIFADKIIVKGEKSLELVQALLVSVIWYFPPEHFEELKFYQMVHLAAVMAIDVGLGKRKNSPKSRLVPYTWRDHPFRKQPLPDPSTIESRRTWLAVYFLASNVAMALHRPNLVRWQSFMTECMDILESSPEAAEGDRYLCHLVWTHRLAEEVGIHFSMDDPSIIVNITESKIQYALRGFERNLAKYSESVPDEDKQPSLLLSFSVLNLYMHEIALQSNDESGAASNAESLRNPIVGLGDSLTAAHISALSSCLTAIDGIFETILGLDVFCIRCLPIFNFVRVAYAVVVLIKIYFSASSPNSELGKVINKDNMKVAEYLDRLYDKFRDTAAQDKSRPASKFLLVLGMLRSWFQTYGQIRSQGDQNADPIPRPPQAGPGSQNGGSAPHTFHEQQLPNQPPQNGNQPEYGAANTPLQLLSEIAAGKGPAQNHQSNRAPPAPNVNAPPYPTWAGPTPYMYDPNPGLPSSTTDGDGALGGAGQPVMIPWMGSNTGYLNMGDGFEQAMGITLTGFGGINPDGSLSYEDSLRMMTQNPANFMTPMDAFPPTTGNPFNA
ncbi:hypothetical protein F4861DRAFT_177 [Xylaria intraflava]|nr:hypothetical protein F4861DRAFT_177 [Xylaria intraflava]